MAKYVGLDWAGKGWFGVVLRDDRDDGEEEYETEVFPTILSVWHKHRNAERIFIDIPIGLPEDCPRECDVEAADELSPDRRSSVFPTPCRDAIYATTLEEAKELNEDTLDASLSNQTWAIMPRIREVDEFLVEVPDAREKVKEVHPEICFWAFGGEQAMADGKKTEQGQEERLNALNGVDSRADDIYEEARDKHICTPPAHARTLSKNAKDDILDALAAALTAQGNDDQLATIPDDPPEDARGLPMEMVYRTE